MTISEAEEEFWRQLGVPPLRQVVIPPPGWNDLTKERSSAPEGLSVLPHPSDCACDECVPVEPESDSILAESPPKDFSLDDHCGHCGQRLPDWSGVLGGPGLMPAQTDKPVSAEETAVARAMRRTQQRLALYERAP